MSGSRFGRRRGSDGIETFILPYISRATTRHLPGSSCMMAEALSSHCEAVRAFVEQVGETPGAHKVLLAQRNHIEQQLQALSLTVLEAGRLVRALQGIPWPSGIKDTLTSMVADRIVATTASPVLPGRSKMQDYRAFAEYLTEDIWALLMQERTTAQSRMDVLLGHAVKLQLRYPSEASLQRLTAVFLTVSEGHDKAMALTSQLRYNSLQHMKKCFKGFFKPPLSHAILVLPEDPSEFMAEHPELVVQIFGKKGPVPCPLRRIELEILCNAIPMRSTSKAMSSSTVARSPALQGDLANSMLLALQQFMQGGLSAQPVIRMLPRKQLAFLGESGEVALRRRGSFRDDPTSRAADSGDEVVTSLAGSSSRELFGRLMEQVCTRRS